MSATPGLLNLYKDFVFLSHSLAKLSATLATRVFVCVDSSPRVLTDEYS